MMRSIAELTSSLDKVNRDLLASWTAPTAEAMATTTKAIEQRFGSLSRRRSFDLLGERIIESIRKVRDQNGAVDFKTLRLACHGISQQLDSDRYIILGDTDRLHAVLAAVSSYRHELRRFRRLYDGLLSSYLTTERQADWFSDHSIRKGNEHLRAFLHENANVIEFLHPAPEWVGALASFPQILDPNAGERFADAWIAGNKTAFQNAMQRLGLPGTAWLASETIRSALAIAIKLDYHTFTNHIPALLEAAAEPRFQPLRDDVYVALITRYATLPGPPVHAPLRDALVSTWKNPWLERNDPAWRRVPEAARTMVAGWLKLDLIHQFFEVLSEDGRQDKSRFEFWRTYHHQMDDVYFALGSRSFWSKNPDIEKLRRSMDGRLLNLTGTESDNNAFIMCMGEIVVVEFSKKGNAAYRYQRSDLPLLDGKRAVSVSQLKRAPPGTQMPHAWARGLSWQEHFARVLGDQRPSYSMELHSRPIAPDARTDITAFASANAIVIEDHRAKGGMIWLRVDDGDPDIVRQVTQWGFKYRPGRGWWRSDS